MCGRLSVAVSKADLKEYLKENYQIEVLPDALELPKYNVAPSEDLISLISDGAKYRVGLLKWGFIPDYAKDESKPIINARSETVDKLYSFQKSFFERRCIILSDGFFEWERSTSTKTPYRFQLKNKKLFGFAGLWSVHVNMEGKKSYSTTIITTKANKSMKNIHDRMPVILTESMAKKWLNPESKDTLLLKEILKSGDLTDLELYEVTSKVNNAKYKEKDVIEKKKIST